MFFPVVQMLHCEQVASKTTWKLLWMRAIFHRLAASQDSSSAWSHSGAKGAIEIVLRCEVRHFLKFHTFG